MKRKEFLKIAAPAFLLLGGGRVEALNSLRKDQYSGQKIKYRFVVASDGHYGEPGTDYDHYFATAVSRINGEHGKSPFSFCMINGDIIHNDKQLYPAAKKALDELQMKYYVSQGNHDMVTAEEWNAIWKIPVNHDFVLHDNAFLIATTSNEKGEYHCPDLKWFAEKLEEHKDKQNIFIFVHINPAKQTDNAVDCPELLAVFENYQNIRAVFNGHDHDQEGIKLHGKIPFLFDSHIGGSWGTTYRGFRVVEVLNDNSMLTYIMNPYIKINEASLGAG